MNDTAPKRARHEIEKGTLCAWCGKDIKVFRVLAKNYCSRTCQNKENHRVQAWKKLRASLSPYEKILLDQFLADKWLEYLLQGLMKKHGVEATKDAIHFARISYRVTYLNNLKEQPNGSNNTHQDPK